MASPPMGYAVILKSNIISDAYYNYVVDTKCKLLVSNGSSREICRLRIMKIFVFIYFVYIGILKYRGLCNIVINHDNITDIVINHDNITESPVFHDEHFRQL